MNNIKYCKYDRYIFTIHINVFNQRFEILEIRDIVTEQEFNKINNFQINKIYYKKIYYENDDYDSDYDYENENVEENNIIDDPLIEQQNIQEDINNFFYNNFDTYEKAFHHNFIKDKQYLLYPNGYSGIYKQYNSNKLYNIHQTVYFLEEEYFHINGIINGEKITYYYNSDNIDDKIVNSKTKYINNKREGEHIEYYKNGNILIIFNCINDKIEGKYKEFYENNILKIDCIYKSDKKYGKYKEYYDNGCLKIKVNYIDNKKTGIYKEYYDNGSFKKIVNYINDKREGLMDYYDNNGNLKQYEFLNDKCEKYEKDHPVYRGFSGSGLMQLIAYGAQDRYLTGSPHKIDI
jgi:antitoxin component YwqK of YwqJK toxin-antitoxin module